MPVPGRLTPAFSLSPSPKGTDPTGHKPKQVPIEEVCPHNEPEPEGDRPPRLDSALTYALWGLSPPQHATLPPNTSPVRAIAQTMALYSSIHLNIS